MDAIKKLKTWIFRDEWSGMRILLIGFAMAMIGFGMEWFNILGSLGTPILFTGWLIGAIGMIIHFRVVISRFTGSPPQKNKLPWED